MLAYDAFFKRMGVTRPGLVTPCPSDFEERMIANYTARGIEMVDAVRLDDKGNFSYATYPPKQAGAMAEQVSQAKPDAFAIVCTNFRGAPAASRGENATGIPVRDSVALSVAPGQREVGLGPSQVTGWASVFRLFAQP